MPRETSMAALVSFSRWLDGRQVGDLVEAHDLRLSVLVVVGNAEKSRSSNRDKMLLNEPLKLRRVVPKQWRPLHVKVGLAPIDIWVGFVQPTVHALVDLDELVARQSP